jgi:hypothetical protein
MDQPSSGCRRINQIYNPPQYSIEKQRDAVEKKGKSTRAIGGITGIYILRFVLRSRETGCQEMVITSNEVTCLVCTL